MTLSLATWRGEAPRIQPRALPNEMAQTATNTRLLSQGLDAWKDISSVHVLGKPGPTATIYPFVDDSGNLYWFSWAGSELMAGSTQVNVARVPIINDPTIRTIFTGTGPPQLTNKALAINPDVGPYGPYPDASVNLGVPAPTVAPSVVNIPPLQPNVITTTVDPSFALAGWTSGVTGGFAGGFVVDNGPATDPSYSADPNMLTPVYHGSFEPGFAVFANAPASFNFANCVSFTFDIDISPDVVHPNNAPNGYITLIGGSLLSGPRVDLMFGSASTGDIVYTDQVGGTGPSTLAFGVLSDTLGYHVHFAATNLGLDADGSTRLFEINFTVSLIAIGGGIGATVFTAPTQIGTYGGEVTVLGGFGGSTSEVQTCYVGHPVWVVTTPPANFIPVYSNYLYTIATPLLLESAPSPVSTPVVQVDNNYTNAVSIPDPGAQPVAEFFLYRAATGATGTSYLQVVNGLYTDGGFPVCTVTGTANTIVLTNIQGQAPQVNTTYFFKAIATNTGATTINGFPVNDTTGAALAAGSILINTDHSVVFEQPLQRALAQPALNKATRLIFSDVTGIVTGMPVSDSAGSILPGTVVAGPPVGNAVTISQGIGTALVAGDVVSFANTIPAAAGYQTYTLLGDPTPTPAYAYGYTYLDSTPTADLGVTLPSADWDPPPDDMINVIALPNGIIAGSSGNTLLLSVQGEPQAYPLAFQLATDSPIVALAALDANIAILTEGHPYTAYGATPDAFTMTKETFIQGCVSARSVSYLRGYGAVYASTDGIYAYGGLGQIRNLTASLFTLQEWSPLNPSTITGIVHQGLYFFWYQAGSTKRGYVLDAEAQGFGLIELDFHAIAAALDSSDDTLYLVLDGGTIPSGAYANNTLLQWEGANTYRPYVWHSKLFQLPYGTGYNLCRVRAEDYTGLVLKLYADGSQFATLNPTSDFEFVIPPQLGRTFEFELDGATPIETIQFVELPAELT